MTTEIWAVVKSHPLFEVSDMGNVRWSCKNGVHVPEFMMGSYLHVKLRRGCWSRYNKNSRELSDDVAVHRLVGIAFLPNPDKKPIIDHIDLNKTNNCLTNLRWVTHAENMRNKALNVNNKTGYKGVSFDRRTNKYVATLQHNGIKYQLGGYDKLEDAVNARRLKEDEIAAAG
jgi:hypothetical protein